MKAGHWLSEMMNAVVEAKSISCTTVLKACAESRDMARAEHILAHMINTSVKVARISYSTVSNACAEAGDAIRVGRWLL